MWSVVVITTANEAQKDAFEQQIHDKLHHNELPLDLPIHVLADPPGPRIGMVTETCLAFILEPVDVECSNKPVLEASGLPLRFLYLSRDEGFDEIVLLP